jgi:arylsulfatase A-like enzyme
MPCYFKNGVSPDIEGRHTNPVNVPTSAPRGFTRTFWTLMISQTAAVRKAEALGSLIPGQANERRLGIVSILVLSAWCGLVAGLLEVGTIVLRKQVLDPDRLYKMSRHFVWLIPISNVCVFLTLGLLWCVIVLFLRRRGRWLIKRFFGALVLLPSILVAFPRIYGLAWLVVTLGAAAWIVPVIERHRRRFRRFVLCSFPAAAGIVAILGGSIWVSDRSLQARESARPLPPPGSPNVLLIVMDTVAAGHLGLHGYNRATSTTLTELAERGIRFDSARAASSWTLPSHATMFTGRWLHELSVGWLTPLDHKHPTLAEYLGDRGYATAGFVANTFYCGSSSGLARGFTQYHDFIFPELTAFKKAVLVARALDGYQAIVYFTEDWLESAGFLPYVERFWQSMDTDRKGAAEVNRELLGWLSNRTQPERPFFAFLNYFDAHYPYRLEPGRLHRFGVAPTDSFHRILIQQWWDIDKTTLTPDGISFAADSYDDCIADLDEQLGKLVDELDRRAVLEKTWLIIASDHGESFGEHPGIFIHGASLYDTELHVPLLVIPPGSRAAKKTVGEPVSLRDLAATIVELTGSASGSPFPGDSLTRFWNDRSSSLPPNGSSSASALAEVVPNSPGKRDYWGLPQERPPLGAVKNGEWSYIRQEEDVREALFHLREDAKEMRNRADDPAAQTVLQQMRAALDRLTGGPLSQKRFNH